MKTLRGIAASPGIAIGPAFLFQPVELKFERRTGVDPIFEWERFQAAVARVSEELSRLCAKTKAECGPQEAEIFAAHALMLEDPEWLNAVRTGLEYHINAEAALSEATEMYAQMLEELDNPYFAARATDVRDVGRRVLRVLLGVDTSPTVGLMKPSILLADDLTPSDTALLDTSLVLGLCTARGGATSHTTILARGLGLPAVVGVGPSLLEIPTGVSLILDGEEGTLHVEPDESTRARYWVRRELAAVALTKARQFAHEPAVTRDGYRVEVVANIGNVAGAQAALEAGAEGVGLLRTEFLYLERSRLPDEEEQYQAYRAILDVFEHRPVVLRTLDIGGDKDLPYLQLERELNPFLGLRAIRLCLQRPDLFKPQIRAALRAGVGRNLKLMFPMVATVSEIKAARAMVEECRLELQDEGFPVAERVEVGIMIEVPAAAIMADRLAPFVDFFSIGTNDLSQYTMAADRTNAHVATLASALQPAVLRLVSQVITAGHKHGKWVGLCGELAGEPVAIPILLGMGLDEFSMNPSAIPLTKQIIRTLALDEARQIAQQALKLDGPEEIVALVQERMPALNLDK